MDDFLSKSYLFFLYHTYKQGLPKQILDDFIKLFTPSAKSPYLINNVLEELEQYTNLSIERINQSQNIQIYLNLETIKICFSIIIETLLNDNQIFHFVYLEKEEIGYQIPTIICTTSYSKISEKKYAMFHDIIPLSLEDINDSWSNATNGGKIIILQNEIHFKLCGFRQLTQAFPLYFKEIPQLTENNIDNWFSLFFKKELTNKFIDIKVLTQTFIDSLKDFLPALPELNIDSGIPLYLAEEIKIRTALLCGIIPTFWNNSIKSMIINLSYNTEKRITLYESHFITTQKTSFYEEKLNIFIKILKCYDIKFSYVIEQEKEKNQLTISISVPDTLGTFLDEKIPGWEKFSPTSKELLRRISYQYNLAFDHPITLEIIMEEVFTLFFPFLTSSISQNLANDCLNLPTNKSIHPEIKNLLEQIKKGKIKRNIISPNHVGKLLSAFISIPNNIERIRKYKTFSTLSQEDLTTLSSLLEKFPDNPQKILLTLANIYYKTSV